MIPFINFDEDFLTTEDLLFLAGASGGNLNEYTATGNPATFSTNVAKPLKSFLIPWTPTQAGSGDPSPENVRSISGITGLTVSHSGADTSNPTTYPVTFPALGKNMLNLTLESGSDSGMEWTVNNGVITVGGTPTAYVALICGRAKLPSSGSVVCSGGYVNGTNITWGVCKLKDSVGETVATLANSDVGHFSFNVSDYPTAETIELQIKRNSNNVQCSGDIKLQVETGTTPSTFEPYTNTVYGGTLDITSGVLTVEWKEVDLGNYEYAKDSVLEGVDRFTRTFSDYGGAYYTDIPDVICDIFKPESIMLANQDHLTWVVCLPAKTGATYFYTPQGTYENAFAFKTAMSGIKMAYKLATPITYQLTPIEIKTLIGDNTIWTDTNGTNTAVYLKRG